MRNNKFTRLMRSLRKYIPLLSKVPKPGARFDEEAFILLLLWQRDSMTNCAENEYIRLELDRNWQARKVAKEVEETFPTEIPVVVTRRGLFLRAAVWAGILLVLGGCIYAITEQMNSEKDAMLLRKVDYMITDTLLRDMEPIIEHHYNVKVVYDRKEVSTSRISGYLDARQPLEAFLVNLRLSHGIEYKIDEQKKELHFK